MNSATNWAWVVDLLQFLALGWVAFVQYVRKPGEDASKDVVQVNKRVDAFEAEHRAEQAERRAQLARLDERMSHMPNENELTRIDGAVNEVRAQVEGMQDLLRRVEHQTNLIHQHLLSQRR